MRREALLERFRAVVAAQPASRAVSDAGRVLDYAALARTSERVAEAIRAVAGGPGGRVLLLCDHRLEAIVALLGALEAGQAIVPLSPHEDDGVLAGFARDAAACALVADRASADRARALARALPRAFEGGAAGSAEREGSNAVAGSPDGHGSTATPGSAERDGSTAMVDVSLDPGSEPARDEGLVVIGLAPDAPPAVAGERSDELLAILYTSGTTAQPKGVMTSAASVLERARQYLEASGLAAGQRQAAITAWHFAASLPEVWGALLAGAELCLYDARRRGIEGLAEWLRVESVGWLQLPVAMARRLLPGLGRGALASVRFASISGDRLRRSEAVALLQAMAPGATLLHTYGSTETNLIAQLPLRLPDRDWPAESEAGYLAVGRPVPGKRVHVLDERLLAPVAPGAPGRIAVEGALLSLGYWRQPVLTAERFRRAASGDPLFVSGDFGRLRADGCLELSGRDANQAKIRGMRVDLAAIEAQLLALEGVAGAAVGLQPAHGGVGAHAGGEARRGGRRGTQDGVGVDAGRTGDEADEDLRLVAWIEPRADSVLDTTRLRRALQGRLPAHWIPARFVFVEALPWTANGKLDRRRLPDPGSARPRLGVAYAAPRDETEAWVCTVWARLFALDAVGRDDDFFDLGGDSLRLLELFTTIERATGHPLALADLAGLPTPARVAELLRRATGGTEVDFDAAVGGDRGAGRGAGVGGLGRGRREGGGAAASRGSAEHDEDLRFLGVRAAGDATGPLPRRLRRALKHSLRHPLRGAGPILLGRPLPYATGFAVQRRIARVLGPLPPFRARLRVVDAWHARLGLDSDPAQARLRSFLANTWGEWRLRALEDPIAFERAVAIEGSAVLEDLADRGRGLVLVVSHVYWNALLARLPALRKRPFTLIRQPKGERFGRGEDAVGTARAEQLLRAARVLAQGGVALIAGDAGRGQAAVEIPFHGVLRRFRPGAATLAETTGAVLAPVFSWLELDGRIVFRFETPLASDAASPEARIRDCTERYAALYAERWPRIFDSLAWKNVRRALDPPQDW